MTQTPLKPALGLNLTPMQVPESVPTPAAQGKQAGVVAKQGKRQSDRNLWHDSPQQEGTYLLLEPGNRSELVVHLTNSGDRPLQLSVQVEGNCPTSWYSLALEFSTIVPRQRAAMELWFEIPLDFFERQEPLPASGRLQLDYSVQLRVTGQEVSAGGRGGRQIQSLASFSLAVRSPSLYLDFLPSLYREMDFVGRFLKIFEETFEPSVHTLNTMWAHLDPLTAPEALLPFLASWVGWTNDMRWSVQQQRRLIRRAVEIYRWRGTRRGLLLFLHLYTGLPEGGVTPNGSPMVEVSDGRVDSFSIGKSGLGVDAVIGGGKPFHFTVIIRPPADLPMNESLVRTIIEQEKPAFCTFEFHVEPWYTSDTTLPVNPELDLP